MAGETKDWFYSQCEVMPTAKTITLNCRWAQKKDGRTAFYSKCLHAWSTRDPTVNLLKLRPDAYQTSWTPSNLRASLAEKIKVPTDLVINLLEGEINKGMQEGNKRSLVQGFPEKIQELLEFKQKVSKSHVMNRTLLKLDRYKKQIVH